ncbi:MAG TPA: tetratricopeptide repeat protein [Pyrinomonadaceae bacterium]|jgi:tetratricopeptide (TPR) repeat protein
MTTAKRLACLAATALSLLLFAPVRAGAAEGEVWTSIRSKNFLLVGNAAEREIRRVASRLEQFRQVFSRILPASHFDSNIPVTVIVFKDDAAYRPFEPLYQGQPSGAAGYFQSNPDVDYITLSVDRQHVRNPYTLAFHEYVHLLVRNSFRAAPLWFNEGLAEFYSTFEISDGNKKVTLGKPVSTRLGSLRDAELLPLSTLFDVRTGSAHYNEADKRRLFYAQSWALVHYLLSGAEGKRRPQLAAYLELLASGAPVEDAFRSAFGSDFKTIEGELREYVRRGRYPQQVVRFEQGLEFETELQSRLLSEADVQFYLGDLLLHTQRLEEAESYLRRAVALSPGHALAQASLGMLRLRQNRFGEAREHLRRAVDSDSNNYLLHYYQAYVLSQEAAASDLPVESYYGTEVAELMRSELRRTIELAPNFAEAYRLLALINLVREEQLEESVALLKRAMALAPRREELALLLAQVYLRREEFAVSRGILEPLARRGLDAQVRARAEALLLRVASQEEQSARLKVERQAGEKEAAPPGPLQPCDAPQPGPQLKKLRFEGEQACGMLVRVECAEDGVTLFVETGDGLLRLHKESLNRIRFVTYTAEIRGQVGCGLREPANPVLVTYRPAKNASQSFDGEVVAVEFVPKDWSANH